LPPQRTEVGAELLAEELGIDLGVAVGRAYAATQSQGRTFGAPTFAWAITERSEPPNARS
ncbi:MAG: hypothetical protein QOF88_893, partial [Mycobacterium sp.]|nr:hypothetical protein [Mycobacterium sp.]